MLFLPYPLIYSLFIAQGLDRVPARGAQRRVQSAQQPGAKAGDRGVEDGVGFEVDIQTKAVDQYVARQDGDRQAGDDAQQADQQSFFLEHPRDPELRRAQRFQNAYLPRALGDRGVHRQQNDQQRDHRRQPLHHVKKNIEGRNAVGEKLRQFTRQKKAVARKLFEDARGHRFLFCGVLAFDEDHRAFARSAQQLLHRRERDLDAATGFGFVNADDGHVAPQRLDLVADFDPVVRSLPEIDDRDVARLRQRPALGDAQIACGGEALKIYAVDLANAEAAATAHLNVLSDGSGGGYSRHGAHGFDFGFRDGHVGGGQRDALPALAQHDFDADVGVALPSVA